MPSMIHKDRVCGEVTDKQRNAHEFASSFVDFQAIPAQNPRIPYLSDALDCRVLCPRLLDGFEVSRG